MAILFLFLLGVANFAMHKAVLESGHPLLGQVPWFFHLLGGRFSLVVEFFMLLGTMLMVSQGSAGWASSVHSPVGSASPLPGLGAGGSPEGGVALAVPASFAFGSSLRGRRGGGFVMHAPGRAPV